MDDTNDTDSTGQQQMAVKCFYCGASGHFCTACPITKVCGVSYFKLVVFCSLFVIRLMLSSFAFRAIFVAELGMLCTIVPTQSVFAAMALVIMPRYLPITEVVICSCHLFILLSFPLAQDCPNSHSTRKAPDPPFCYLCGQPAHTVCFFQFLCVLPVCSLWLLIGMLLIISRALLVLMPQPLWLPPLIQTLPTRL